MVRDVTGTLGMQHTSFAARRRWLLMKMTPSTGSNFCSAGLYTFSIPLDVVILPYTQRGPRAG
jgi:hypothetical protein